MLTQAEIPHYLVAAGLTSPEYIVDCDLDIVEASHRNRNFKIVSDRGPSYLVKQLKDASAGDTVANEARVYRLLQELSAAHTPLRCIPRMVKYDADHGILVIELVRNSRDFYEHYQKSDRIPAGAASSLGRALSSLHRTTGAALDSARRVGFMNHCPGS